MMDFLFKCIVIPAYFKAKNYKRLEYYNRIKKRDLMSIEELRQLQWAKLKKLVEHCYKNVPYYNKMFDDMGIRPNDIKSLEDFSHLPVLTKQTLRENFNDLIDFNLPKEKIIYDSTSGSTGTPLVLGRSHIDQEYGFALRNKSNAWCGWEYWHKSAWFVSDTRHIKELDKIKGTLSLYLKRRLLINTKDITTKNMQNWYEQLVEFRPKYIYGYSSLLANFSEYILDNNLKLEGIKGVFSTAEQLIHRDKISRAFNSRVFDQYGASEVPCIAHECKAGNMHINIDEVLIEYENITEQSDIKRMIITPLYLYGMPLLRYDIEDTAIPSNNQCDCGLPYPTMELKVGRISDNLVSSTGKLVSGVTFSWYITDATKGLKQYQVIQQDLYSFIIRLICAKQYRAYNEQRITELMYEMLNTRDISLTFEYTDSIPPGSNGKYRPIVSRVHDSLQRIDSRDLRFESIK